MFYILFYFKTPISVKDRNLKSAYAKKKAILRAHQTGKFKDEGGYGMALAGKESDWPDLDHMPFPEQSVWPGRMGHSSWPVWVVCPPLGW